MVLLAYWAGRASDTEKEGKNKMTKIDIISGFLGAGKTTFIKKLLEEAIAGEQVVLIENEFGEIGIDGAHHHRTVRCGQAVRCDEGSH